MKYTYRTPKALGTGIVGWDEHTATYTFEVVENQLPLKKLTITDVINRTLQVCEPIRKGERPRFRLNGMRADGTIITFENLDISKGEEVGQAALFENILSPEFSFTKQTLRECLQDVGKVVHGEPRLKVKKDENGYYFEVFYDLYGQTVKDPIARRRYSYETYAHDINSYATHLDSNAENLINTLDKYSGVIVEPFAGGNKTVRTEQQYVRITDSNMIIATQYPVYSVDKLEWVDTQGWAGTSGKAYDITAWLFESSIYNSRLSSYDGSYPYSKAYALRYTQGEKNIDALNFKEDAAVFPEFNSYAIVNILRKATNNSSLSFNSDTDYPKLAFRVTYTPIYNARVAQAKPNYKENPREAALIINQQSNLIESRYYGEFLKGNVARLGNIERTRTYKLGRLSSIPKVGTMYDEEYYISSVLVEYLPTYIKCTVGLSKDFNRLSQYIGVSSVKRFSEISQTQAEERNVLYRNYIVIGYYEDADVALNGSIIGNNLLAAIADTFTQTGSYQPITNVVAWGSSFKGNPCPVVNLPVVSSAFGNSISFSWKYEDNYSAGPDSVYQSSGGVEGYFQNDYRYTDYYGKAYYYDFDLQTVGTQTDGFKLPAGEIPARTSGYVSTFGGTPNNSVPYILRKDSREALQVNVQIDFVTNMPDLIIGSALASYCPAVRGSDSKLRAKLYVFPERLNKFIDHVNGSVSVDLSTLPSADVTLNTGGIISGFFLLSPRGNDMIFPASGKSWAIVTAQYVSNTEQVEDDEGTEFTQKEIMGGDVLLARNIDVVKGQALETIQFTRKREIYDKSVWKDKR